MKHAVWRAGVIIAVVVAVESTMAQAPGVEIVRDRGEQFDMLVEKANELLKNNEMLSVNDAGKQLERKICRIDLPEPSTGVLSNRELWQLSKEAHLRVGWHYRCKRCDKWHQNLAGGYYVNAEGAAATCYHVLEKDTEDFREGYLVAANDRGDLFPVLEVLAANEITDVAIVRVKADGPVVPLALNENTYPGDPVWCYSDPLGRSGYFSKGIINRFYVYMKNGKESFRIEVSTDWAPGSSGAAVVDECGNAIGHVSEITSGMTSRSKPVVRKDDGSTNKVVHVAAGGGNSVIVFHCAARAADVLDLVEKPDKADR